MKAVKILSVLIIILSLQGCWGSRETDEMAYVLAMGLDKGPDGNITVTFQIANPKVIAGPPGGGGGGAGREKPLITVSTIAPLPIAAFNIMNVERSRQISLLHTNAFIISEDLAREGLAPYLNPLNRFRETRGTAFVYISRGKASDFMEKNRPELEATPAKQYELISRSFRLHALTSVVQFHKFYAGTKSRDRQPVAPLVDINNKGLERGASTPGALGDYLAGDMPSNKGESQFLGTAVFRMDKMVGTLTGNETRYLNMLTGEMHFSFLVLPHHLKENSVVGVSLLQARKPVIKVSTEGERPIINIELFVEPALVGTPSGTSYENNVHMGVIEKEISRALSEGCRQVVARSQEEFRSDIFGFGRYARKNFLTVQQWRGYDWLGKYPGAEVEIKVNVRIRRTGLMLKTAPNV
ncbi:MAG: Ger(x)C family spore germination protein [Firmicutes bacterium]|nr:Ger(x)C family spore germination protein [Bacillota bacterium]MCL5057948.1 Ger(x)C family spore germination protein [Actinomycetota bacterium]